MKKWAQASLLRPWRRRCCPRVSQNFAGAKGIGFSGSSCSGDSCWSNGRGPSLVLQSRVVYLFTIINNPRRFRRWRARTVDSLRPRSIPRFVSCRWTSRLRSCGRLPLTTGSLPWVLGRLQTPPTRIANESRGGSRLVIGVNRVISFPPS